MLPEDRLPPEEPKLEPEDLLGADER